MKRNNLLALAAGVAGGIVGHFGFLWIARQGFYGLVLPGALVGVGAGLLNPRSRPLCAACGVLGLVAGILSEYRFAPFSKDDSLGYFLTHLHQLRPMTLIMIAAGTVIAFWAPYSNASSDRDAGPK